MDPNKTLARLRAAVSTAAPAKNPPARKAGKAKSGDKYQPFTW